MRVDMTPKEYQAYVKRMQKKSPLGKDMALAFVIGGLICVAGQAIGDGFRAAGLNTEDAGTATSVSLVFLSALLTGLGLYHRLARFGGAGTLVPITALPMPWYPGAGFQGRGLCHRHGGQNVRHCRPGDRLRHTGQRGVRRGAVGAGLTPLANKLSVFHDVAATACAAPDGQQKAPRHEPGSFSWIIFIKADSSGDPPWCRCAEYGSRSGNRWRYRWSPWRRWSGPCTRGRPQRRRGRCCGRTM